MKCVCGPYPDHWFATSSFLQTNLWYGRGCLERNPHSYPFSQNLPPPIDLTPTWSASLPIKPREKIFLEEVPF